jgi:ParB family transcriptional regulator, chromosome partitioning protein
MPETLREFSLGAILPSRWQARTVFDATALEELARSIQAHGLINPLVVFIRQDGHPELIGGERRTRALLATALHEQGKFKTLDAACEFFATHGPEIFEQDVYAQWALDLALKAPPVPCRVVAGTPDQLQEIALLDNLQRADLSAFDEARALRRMTDEHGYTQRQLAAQLAKSQTWISQRLLLLELVPDVAERVVAGDLDPAAGREIARLDPAVQTTVADAVRDRHLSSRQAANTAKKIIELADPAAWTTQDLTGDNLMAAQLVHAALEQQTPAKRQQTMTAWTLTDANGGVKPANTYEWRRLLLTTLGLDQDSDRTSAIWSKLAPELLGLSCDSCAFLPYRERLQLLWRNRSDSYWYQGFPQCAKHPDSTAPCEQHAAAAAADVAWAIPAGDRESRSIPPDLQAAVVDNGYDYLIVRGIEPGLAIGEALHAQAQARKAAAQQVVQTGLADAITLYVHEQDGISPLVPWSQTCDQCLFHRSDSRDPAHACHWQDHSLALDTYNSSGMANAQYENTFSLWTDGEHQIGRCALFKYRNLRSGLNYAYGMAYGLRTVGGVVRMLVLKQVCARESYGNNRFYVPPWLDVEAKAEPGRWIPWGEAEKTLSAVVKDLSQGQVLALWSLIAASRQLPVAPKLAQKADVLDPFTDHWQHWQCIAVFGRGVAQRVHASAEDGAADRAAAAPAD